MTAAASDTPSSSTSSSTAPDWSAITETIRCPLCEYELRGLSEPRCPECGYRFDWPDVLDPTRRVHPYLFEHHPRRNVWSFVRKKLAGFAPWRFWQTLQPTARVHPRRLVLYWLIHVPLLLLILLGAFVRYFVDVAPGYQMMRARLIQVINADPNDPGTQRWIRRHGSVQNAIDADFPDPYSIAGMARVASHFWSWKLSAAIPGYVPITAMLLLWPWLTFATLMIFRGSMSRAKVRPIHVVRCVIYSGDVFLIAVVLLLPVVPQFSQFGYDPIRLFRVLLLACGVLSVLMLAKLGFAYRLYLRFPHAWSTAIASQILVSLSILSIASFVMFWMR
jgi:hypothetical protein